MGSRLKEEERNERTIRSLLKLNDNRRCINCGSMGPQYVCTNFSTFVCTSCSGVHREFTHRIKSVSMAKFTAAEVDALKNGGNQRAREVFLKDWDVQKNSLPDSSHPDKLRDFIKSVYVDRRYTGERLPSKVRQGERDDDIRRPDLRRDFRAGSRSPPFDNRYDDRRSTDGRRSDVDRGRPSFEDRRYENDDRRAVRFDEKKSPGHLETSRGRYDGRQYEERPRHEEWDRRSEDRLSNEVRERRRNEDRNNGTSKDFDGGISPQIRSVREILGDNVPPLRVDDCGQINGRHEDESRSLTSPADQRKDLRTPHLSASGSFGNGGSSISSSSSLQRVTSDSLIDFSAETPTPIATSAPTDIFGGSTPSQPPQAAWENSGWATFDTAFPQQAGSTTAAPSSLASLFPAADGGGGEWSTGWAQPVLGTASGLDSWSAFPAPQPHTGPAPQSWNSFPTSKVALPAQSGFDQPSNNLVQPDSGVERPRRELPQDIFASPFHSTATQNSVQNLAFLTGGAQFNPVGTAASGGMPAYTQAARSRNPFDLPSEPPVVAPNVFPNLAPLQAALPNLRAPVALPGIGQRVGVNDSGAFPPWAQPNMMGLQPASYPSATSLAGGGFIGLPPQNNPMGNQGPFSLRSFGQDPSFFNYRPSQLIPLSSLPSLGGETSLEVAVSQNSLPALAAQSSASSSGGNPFG